MAEGASFQEFKETVHWGMKKNIPWTYKYVVEDRAVDLELHGTWIKKYMVDGLDYSGSKDASMTVFNRTLAKPFI